MERGEDELLDVHDEFLDLKVHLFCYLVSNLKILRQDLACSLSTGCGHHTRSRRPDDDDYITKDIMELDNS